MRRTLLALLIVWPVWASPPEAAGRPPGCAKSGSAATECMGRGQFLAKRPETVPQHSFAVRLPAEWVSPAPDQWCSPDGTISLVWSEVALKKDPELWAAQAQKHFPGSLYNKDLKLQLGGQPAWLYVGNHDGRIQRVYLTARAGRGVVLVCTCNPAQNFAVIGLVQEILDSFRWLP